MPDHKSPLVPIQAATTSAVAMLAFPKAIELAGECSTALSINAGDE